MPLIRPGAAARAVLIAALTAQLPLAGAQHAHGGRPVHEIAIPADELAFEPAELTVPPGSTIRWVSEADRSHTVTSTFSQAEQRRSGQFRHEFDERGDHYDVFLRAAGDYPYYCEVHPGPMRGVVHVVEGASHEGDAVHEDDNASPGLGPILLVMLLLLAARRVQRSA